MKGSLIEQVERLRCLCSAGLGLSDDDGEFDAAENLPVIPAAIQ